MHTLIHTGMAQIQFILIQSHTYIPHTIKAEHTTYVQYNYMHNHAIHYIYTTNIFLFTNIQT